jgi:uncharacterized membrane protein
MPYPPFGGRFGHHVHHLGRGRGLLALLFLLVVVAAVAIVVVLIVRTVDHRRAYPWTPYAPPREDAAIAHVRMRYASGEITRDEYARLSADLGVPVAPAPQGPAAPPG